MVVCDKELSIQRDDGANDQDISAVAAGARSVVRLRDVKWYC